jgi:Fur family ferric uptake transcriptional regulator
MACEQVFAEQLRRRGLRMTPQREMVLSALHHAGRFATAEELHARVQRTSAAVDLSTIYRTLDLLREFGLVAAVEAGDRQMRYELLGVRGPHLHLACQACGRILGVSLEAADPLLEALLAEHGFAAQLDDVTIPGLCADCRARRGAPAHD